jgi:tyrosyl-tRNA synthetase
MFGARRVPDHILPASPIHQLGNGPTLDAVPCTDMPVGAFDEGIPAFKLFQMVGLSKTGGEARRLIDQGGGYVNGQRLASGDIIIYSNDISNMEIVLRAGKKRFHKIRIKA